jgi:hypothetical protein
MFFVCDSSVVYIRVVSFPIRETYKKYSLLAESERGGSYEEITVHRDTDRIDPVGGVERRLEEHKITLQGRANMPKHILISEIKDHVSTLTLNRAEKKNALLPAGGVCPGHPARGSTCSPPRSGSGSKQTRGGEKKGR